MVLEIGSKPVFLSMPTGWWKGNHDNDKPLWLVKIDRARSSNIM